MKNEPKNFYYTWASGPAGVTVRRTKSFLLLFFKNEALFLPYSAISGWEVVHGLTPHFRGGVLNGLDDILVARAAAEIARHPVADFSFRRVRVFLQQPVGAGDHARRTKPALQAVLLA